MPEIKRRFNVILGSTSDEAKIVPGIQRFTQEFPFEVLVHYASKDNTPDKVDRIVHRLITHGLDVFVFVSGAGLSNLLTGVIKASSQIYDLNLGIPVTDDSSDGLTALLSTAEKPPYNPVLAVGLNNSYAALNIANRFANALNHTGRELTILKGRTSSEEDGVVKLVKQCEEFGLPFKFVMGDSKIVSDSLLLNVYDFMEPMASKLIQLMDERLNKGVGIQIGVSCAPIKESYGDYLHMLDGTYTTGIVSSQNYTNAALMGAILTRNEAALVNIHNKRQERVEKLEAHKGLRIAMGAVEKL